MKKILCGILCASAGAVLADVTNTVATIDVIEVTSTLSNTVVAIPGLDLSSGGELAISNLVKTTQGKGLTPGDRLLAFSGGKYEIWTLNNSRKWEKNDKKFSISGTGAEASDGTDASLFTLPVGSGIWLSRQGSGSFFVYGAHTNVLSTVVAAGTTALVGNPSMATENATPSIAGAYAGDQILVPTSKFLKTYTYSSGAWKSMDDDDNIVTGLPQIERGQGFWYKSTGSADVTISW